MEWIQASMRGWYGPPIHLLDVPGSVRVTKDGDFIGPFERGVFYSALDSLEDHLKRLARGLSTGRSPVTAYAGFASISDALSRASQGYRQVIPLSKVGPTGVTGITSSLWRVGNTPAAGGAPGAAPGGTAFDKTTTGAMFFTNPAAGKLRLVGADAASNVVNNSLLIYDRIFGVVKTMNSTGTEAVTGVPTRFQSTTPTSEDYAGGNFLAIEVGGTALAATAHNWTVCTYTDQDGNTGATLPSVAGVSSAIVDRHDYALASWYAPLAAGDSGIKALTQMQCSAAVATGVIWFVIGHPIGIMSFPIVNTMFPFDWLTNRDQAPYIPNDACLAMYELVKPATTATTYAGQIYATSTSA
jgi:hypothetical protein